jgi:transposase-like protein
LTPNKHDDEFEHEVKLDVEARVRQGVKAVLEEVLEEEMSEHLRAGYRELTPTRRGERNGYYQRNLVTPAGKIERLEVPRDREGQFVTEVFERYKRMTGDVEEAVLEMYLSGISVRKIAGVTDALSKVRIGKDAVSRIASRLEEQQKEWRERPLGEKAYPYLYLDATYLKVRWGASVTSMALLVCVGVDEEGFREVLAVEVAGSEKGAAYASLLRGLIDRGLKGVPLVVSDDHEGIKAAVAGELPGAEWQRCVVHTIRTQSGFGRCRRTHRVPRWAVQGDDVAYLQGVLPNNNALDQELQDGLFLLEGGLIEPSVDPPTEDLEVL